MDGSSHDQIARGTGQLLRNKTVEEAVEEYWSLVHQLIIRRASPEIRTSADNRNDYLYLQVNGPIIEVTENDFWKINQVASKLRSYPIFKTQPFSDTKGRIQAELMVEFSDD